MVPMDRTKNELKLSNVIGLNQLPEDVHEPAAEVRELMRQETVEKRGNDTDMGIKEVLVEEEFTTHGETATMDRTKNKVKLSNVGDQNQLPEDVQERVADVMNLFQEPKMRQENVEKLDADAYMEGDEGVL